MPYDVSGWVEVIGVEPHLRVDRRVRGGDEVTEHRAPGAPSVAGTAWAHVVRSVELLLDRPSFGRVPCARIVVWANG